MLSEAKHLRRPVGQYGSLRCFASLSMTRPGRFSVACYRSCYSLCHTERRFVRAKAAHDLVLAFLSPRASLSCNTFAGCGVSANEKSMRTKEGLVDRKSTR